ncbi:MAG: Ca-activated chloride channel [Pyrinomonadaceae bacterium]|jgi:VWFA-related protein|nr:Ca-activated chloride channel [Pyrinomonadaceae bacterium]
MNRIVEYSPRLWARIAGAFYLLTIRTHTYRPRRLVRLGLAASERMSHRSTRNQLLSSIILVASALLLPRFAVAQEKDVDQIIKVNTDLVVFDAQVIDKKTKRVIGDLTKDNFELSDNGTKQQISYFSRDELSLSIILLLDVSRSVRPIIHQIRDGALNALRHLKPEDQVAVMAFSEGSELAQDFTADRALVSKQIKAATATDVLGNGTFLGPALESAALHMQKAPAANSRRVIIVITDNIAPSMGAKEKEIVTELLANGTVVYGLIVRGAIGKVFNVISFGQIKAVNKYVNETGGEVIGADKNEVDLKLGAVIDRLRARYAIGFRPTNTNDDGKLRLVAITIADSKKRKDRPIVLTKRGYYLKR